MFKFKKHQVLLIVLFILTGSIIISGLLQAEEVLPNCEKGDAVFRPLAWWDPPLGVGHVAIYFNSHSLRIDPRTEIINSDLKHNVIQASGKNETVGMRSFSYFLQGLSYNGAYNSGDLDAEERQKILEIAFAQYGCHYPRFPDEWYWPAIKEPKGQDLNGDEIYGMFRCDALVEYCYESIGEGFFTDDEEKRCWFHDREGNWQWPIFYPDALRGRMTEAEVILPEVRIESSEEGTLKAYASDGDDGSGITMVEFWDGEPDDTPDEAPGVRLRWDDHDVFIGGYYEKDIPFEIKAVGRKDKSLRPGGKLESRWRRVSHGLLDNYHTQWRLG